MKMPFMSTDGTITCPLTGNTVAVTHLYMNNMMTRYPDFIAMLTNNLNTGEQDINKVFKQTFLDFVTKYPQKKNKFLPYTLSIFILCIFRCQGFKNTSPKLYRALGQNGFFGPGAYNTAPLHVGAFLWVLRNESDPIDMKSVYYVHNCMVILNRLDGYHYVDDRLDQDAIWPRFFALPLYELNWLMKWSMGLLRELIENNQIVMNPEPLYGY